MEKSNGNYITRRKFLEISTLGVGSLFVSDFNLNILPTTTQTKSNEIITACNQCYLGCGILAKVIDGRVISLRGQPESPINKGRICAKAHASIYKLYHPERLGYPLMRVGERGEGKWKRITWEKALNIVSKSILKIKNEYAPQSIALWQNTDNDRPDIFQRFIYSLGSPNFLDHTGSVGAPLGTGMALGPVEAIPDYKNAECILIIGANPLGCKQLCWSAKELIQAIHNGAILITVDPRMSETARHSSKGLWLPIKPGTDGILLAGFANYLISNNKYDKNFVNTYTFGFYKIKNYLKQFTVQKVCEKTDIPVNQFMKAVQSMIGKRTVVDILSGASFQPDGAYVGHMRVILSALLGSVDIMGGIIPLPQNQVSRRRTTCILTFY
ncbi:MAG: molybdopterin-dependent oxidoreductase [Spirochaetota bacterium]|nr:molybdopterin-dependent oxidoreductase [Spirochaetota bacterium]